MRISIAVFVLFLLALPVSADIISIPFDQPTIQAGINAAGTGDEVVVTDGTWTGPGNVQLNFHGKAITVRSGNGPLHCIIDMENTARAALFSEGEGTNSVLQGFTLRNGYAAGDGGAILISGIESPTGISSPTIAGNIIENCTADGNGGGVRGRHA